MFTSKRKKINNCLSEVFTYTEEVTQKSQNSCSEKFKKIPWKTSAVVNFSLNFTKNSTSSRTVVFEIIWESCRDGFLFYRCSRSKMLEQLFSKIQKNFMEKIRGGVTFSILANKALYDGQQLPESFKKAALKSLRKFSRKRP